ncbi:hypothetical protein GCM10009554_44810 [Kribbella koreensis]|uniref:Uncharacterized protein n=1 Tax=Kribbella koreensis TaxID=57909 RepID=A0ABP4B983_9ACTN
MVVERGFAEAVAGIMSNTSPNRIIQDVHGIVGRELARLDPTAEIETTTYFNHSYVPDFVLSWGKGSLRAQRAVYLRNTLEASVVSQDAEELGAEAPVVLSLARTESSEVIDAADLAVEEAPRILMTNAAALEEFTEDTEFSNPLEGLVRSNLVRGARGLLTPERARQFTIVPDVADEGYIAAIRRNFDEPAAFRLSRAAQIIRLGLGDGLDEFFRASEPFDLAEGELSVAELAVILPYLLRHPQGTYDPRFWEFVGLMTDLASVEAVAVELSDMDITRIVLPNLNNWFGIRASLGIRPDLSVDNNRAYEDGWQFNARMLALIVDRWIVHISSDARHLKGRKDSAPARWEDLVNRLEGLNVSAVRLVGASRRVDVSSDRSADVRSDVATISASIDDAFHVPEVRVGFDESSITADFSRMLATAQPSASLRELVNVTLTVLGYRYPISDEYLWLAGPE